MCVCVCVSMRRAQPISCKCATSARNRPKIAVIQRPRGLHAAILVTSHTHTMLLPVGSKRSFCRGFVPGYIHRRPATFTPRWTPPVNTTLSPHPLGSLELAAGLPCGPSGAPDGHFYGQGAQQPLTPGLSGVGLASPPI